MHPLDLVLHIRLLLQLGSYGSRIWVATIHRTAEAPSLVPGKNASAAHPVSTQPPCSESLSRGLLPHLFPHLIFSSGLFLFRYLFSLHEMCLKEPSSDAVAEPLSSYCFTVGKTSLITRFMYDSFDNTYQVRSWVPLPSLVSAAMTVPWSPPWPLSRAC